LFNGFGVKNSDVHVVNSYSEDIPQEVEGAADAGGVTFQVDTKASKLFINHAICHFIDVRIDTPQISPQPGTLLKTSLSRIELDCTLLPRQGLDVLHKNTARRLRQSFGRELAAQASFKGIHTSFSWASIIWINHKWNKYFLLPLYNRNPFCTHYHHYHFSFIGEKKENLDRLCFVWCWREFDALKDGRDEESKVKQSSFITL
jgi:hypothetical protein